MLTILRWITYGVNPSEPEILVEEIGLQKNNHNIIEYRWSLKYAKYKFLSDFTVYSINHVKYPYQIEPRDIYFLPVLC